MDDYIILLFNIVIYFLLFFEIIFIIVSILSLYEIRIIFRDDFEKVNTDIINDSNNLYQNLTSFFIHISS